MYLTQFVIPKQVASFAVQRLASADYEIATRISHATAKTVDWALNHDMFWLSDASMQMLSFFDSIGSIWITLVTWIVLNVHQ